MAFCGTTRRQHGWSAALIVMTLTTVSVSVSAQTKPDFSGRWVLATPRKSTPDIPSALMVHLTLARANVYGEPMPPFFRDITIELQFESGTRSETHFIGVEGGVVSGVRADGSRNGPTTLYSVRWEGDALVFERGSHTGPRPETGAWTEHGEVWTLDSDGHLRIAIATRSAEDSRAITLVYRRP